MMSQLPRFRCLFLSYQRQSSSKNMAKEALRIELVLGGIQQLCGQNFVSFDPPCKGQFFYPERGQKQNFLTPSPLILST